ncbi:MAG TPA: hypothetical protein VJZ71_20815 [Phycisphaerae bacterium]|nr:hypothetical protein [Phycisphaerae bacterium]
MPRRRPETHRWRTPRSAPTPEERLLAQVAFRYEIGVLRAWDDVRHASARAVDPRTWIQRHPLGSVVAAGAVGAICGMKRKEPPPPPGIRTALRKAGFALLRRAAISGLMTRIVWRIWDDVRPASPGNPRPPAPAAFRRYRPDRSSAKWN